MELEKYPKIISLFKFGLINIHRGIVENTEDWTQNIGPCTTEIINIGITIHQVRRSDTGKVIVQRKLKMKNFQIYMLRYITTVIATKEIVKIIKYFLKKKNSNIQILILQEDTILSCHQ